MNCQCACFSLKDPNPYEALQWNATVHNLSPSQLLSLAFPQHLSKIAMETMMQKTALRVCKSNPRSPTLSWKAALYLEAEWQWQVHRLRENNMGTFPVNIKPAYVLQGFFQIFLVFSIALLKEILWAREGGFAWQNHHPSLIPPRRPLLSVCHLIKRVRRAMLTSPCSMQTTSLTSQKHSVCF